MFTKIQIDTFDVIWFFGFWAFGVLVGVDPATEWFTMFTMAMFFWFLTPVLDRWTDKVAERKHQEWLASLTKEPF